jgi:cadmium resistance protein CadD (predicted permease)
MKIFIFKKSSHSIKLGDIATTIYQGKSNLVILQPLFINGKLHQAIVIHFIMFITVLLVITTRQSL